MDWLIAGFPCRTSFAIDDDDDDDDDDGDDGDDDDGDSFDD